MARDGEQELLVFRCVSDFDRLEFLPNCRDQLQSGQLECADRGGKLRGKAIEAVSTVAARCHGDAWGGPSRQGCHGLSVARDHALRKRRRPPRHRNAQPWPPRSRSSMRSSFR